MLPLERFERLWPMPQPVLPLLRALLIGDADRAVELGCLDLAEEDLALVAYACPGKLDYGAALRATLSQLGERDQRRLDG
jgi:Na+-transporting NADH:ubiquinone oxidoreductase subunit A